MLSLSLKHTKVWAFEICSSLEKSGGKPGTLPERTGDFQRFSVDSDLNWD